MCFEVGNEGKAITSNSIARYASPKAFCSDSTIAPFGIETTHRLKLSSISQFSIKTYASFFPNWLCNRPTFHLRLDNIVDISATIKIPRKLLSYRHFQRNVYSRLPILYVMQFSRRICASRSPAALYSLRWSLPNKESPAGQTSSIS
jgi:hypothetical protein